MNPGYDVHDHKWNPHITPSKMNSFRIVDFIIKEKLFTFFMLNGCIPGTAQYKVQEKIMTHNPWESPVKIFGYDDTWAIAGDIFEAETLCTKKHNMGQIASSSTANLAWYSHHIISKNLKQKYSQEILYNPKNVYINIVYGDGDNLGIALGGVRKRILEILDARIDFPVTFSLSPHLSYLAPRILEWFYKQAENHNIYYIMPPSGYLYAYPGLMLEEDQKIFVKHTENYAKLMDTNGFIAWEFFLTWKNAIVNYFPKYNRKMIAFCVNVPYLFPIIGLNNQYQRLGEIIALKPIFTWYGAYNSKSGKEVAKILNDLEAGTISYIFVGIEIRTESIQELFNNLNTNIKIVSSIQLYNLLDKE